jgi:uncharacterized protein YndB with AHSA1/START domain
VKWVLIVVAVLIAAGGLVFLIGSLLPVSHEATVRAHYNQPVDSVFAVVTDVARAAEWRDELSRVEVLSGPGEPLRWREEGQFGPMTYVREVYEPPSRCVVRIADASQGFGGSWMYEVTPDATGATLTITEAGEVYNPFFRFMSRFVFGHHATMESYARALGRRFGEETRPERVVDEGRTQG